MFIKNPFQVSRVALLGLTLACGSPLFAAKAVNLAEHPFVLMQSMSAQGSSVQEKSRSVDFNQTTHVRLQQTFQGHNVWGADGVAHIPHAAQALGKDIKQLSNAQQKASSMNGVMYQDLAGDLNAAPAFVHTEAQAQKALEQAVQLYQKESGIKAPVLQTKTDLIVYVDQSERAHWAYLVSFLTQGQHLPAKPTAILDATTLTVYKQWNNLQTIEHVTGGGYGGNQRMGKLVYDGLKNDLSTLDIERDAKTKTCMLENDDVVVKNQRKSGAVLSFACKAADAEHKGMYWDGDLDAANGGFSPGNDALYAGKIIKAMYQDWYDMPVLTKGGKPMTLVMRVHENMDNAYWDGEQMTFGDGVDMFYPLTSLGVAAHEVSHGFTEQHSNLVYEGQSGGLNESFSDMAAQAAEFYSVKKNSWQIGPEIFKEADQALRYMDEPTKDCHGSKPGSWCSIDNMSQYSSSIDVHYTSGIFNKLFYLMGTTEGWDTKKAFDVMVKANANYWTSTTSFNDAACGVLKATADYKYDTEAVIAAMKEVGLDAKKCSKS